MSEASDDEDIFATDAQRELRAAARRYLDRGWKLVRLRQGTKRAFDKGWPNRDVTPEQFSHEMNIGLRFGPQSGGLVDVDLDYASARELVGRPVFRLNHLVEFGRPSLPPGRRGHRLVIAPDGPDKTRVFGIRGKAAKAAMEALGLGFTIAEIRASHGSQSAVPPSVHVGPNGDDPLVWTAPAGDAAEIPTLAWDTLNERVGRLALCSLAAVLYPRGPATRDEFCGRLLGTLLEGKALPMPAEAMVCEVARLNGDETDFHAPDAMEGLEGFLDLVGLTAIAPVVAPWLGLRPSPDAVPDVTRHGKLPPWRHEELPPLRLAEESRNDGGTNRRNPFVERSTGGGDEDAGGCRGDGAAEGVRVGRQADRPRAGLQPSHG